MVSFKIGEEVFRIFFVVAMIGLMLNSGAWAETIVLKTGQSIKGEIIEQTPMRVMIDVDGNPKTFFLGEIESIEVKKVEVAQPNPAEALPKEIPAQETKKEALPYYNDEQDSLVRFMQKRTGDAVPVQKSTPEVQENAVMLSPPTKILPGVGGEMNKNVVPTSDGGIIVVGSTKITKYDKDLNVIKEKDLDTGTAPATK